jgi:hypothetical protein
LCSLLLLARADGSELLWASKLMPPLPLATPLLLMRLLAVRLQPVGIRAQVMLARLPVLLQACMEG